MAAKALKAQPVPALRDAAEPSLIEALLACAGPLDGMHTFVSAYRGADLLCTLIRNGCLDATCVKPGAKPDRTDYNLVLIPDIGCLESADDAIRTARRTLTPSGRLVMGTREARKSVGLTHRLRLNGFRAIRTIPRSGLTVVCAEAPAGAASAGGRSS